MLGVNLDSVNLVDILIGDWSKTNNVLKGDKAYSEDLDMSKSQNISFGWPEIQAGVIREVIAVAEVLPQLLVNCKCPAQAVITCVRPGTEEFFLSDIDFFGISWVVCTAFLLGSNQLDPLLNSCCSL